MNVLKGFKAKLRDKREMPAWYQERLNICKKCPKNSGNQVQLSFKDKARIVHNLGKDACLVCSCGIADLASDPTVECSDSIPKWRKVRLPNYDGGLCLENHSPSRGNLIKEGKWYFFEYNKLRYLDNTAIQLFISTKRTYQNFKVLASCGCTIPSWEKEAKGYSVEVAYNSTILGHFEKQVSISYMKNLRIREDITFWIKGNILERK